MTERNTGSFKDFEAYTLAVVRGVRDVDPNEPKLWVERTSEDKLDLEERSDRREQENGPS